jgi:hypothetical protein
MSICREGIIMNTLDYEYFFRQLKAGISIDETCFYFVDDPQKEEHYIGFLPQYEKPYWVGYCDIPDGCEFHTAEELVNAKIFDGQSLIERWRNSCKFFVLKNMVNRKI